MFILLCEIIVGIIILEGFILIKRYNKAQKNRRILLRIFLWQILSPIIIVILAILEGVFASIFPPAAPELSRGLWVILGFFFLSAEEILLSCVGLPLALYTFYADRCIQKKWKILFTCLLICATIGFGWYQMLLEARRHEQEANFSVYNTSEKVLSDIDISGSGFAKHLDQLSPYERAFFTVQPP